MKKIVFATGLLAMMVAATSCDKYDIYPEAFDGVFAIRDAGTKELTVYSTDELAQVPFVVLKGGYDPELSSTATLKVMDQQEFANYQESSGNVHYALIGRECYSFAPTTGQYSVDYNFDNADDRYRVTDLYIHPGVLKQWLEDNAAELGSKVPVIPVTLVSAADSVSEYNKVSIIVPTVKTPALTLDVSGVQARTINASTITPETSTYSPEANFSIPCNNPWGFTLNVVSDPSLITEYNNANGTSYEELPADLFTLKTQYHFAENVTSMPVELTIKLDDPRVKLRHIYAVAVRLADDPITWDSADNNPGSALAIGDAEHPNVVIFTVRVFDAVVLDKLQLSSANVTSVDMEPQEGSINELFDGNPGTFYHSAWSVTIQRSEPFASYLEITLPEPMTYFRFNVVARTTSDNRGHIKTVRLFGTNDLSNWNEEPFATITNMTDQLNGSGARGEFGSDEEPFEAPEAYKYIRFSVYESNGGKQTAPSSGSLFWHAAELELYGF